MRFLRKIRGALDRLSKLEDATAQLRESIGRIESRQLRDARGRIPGDIEYRVFSQWGEDGIIDRLTALVPVQRRFFVEFGVEDYSEANTRFLLTQKNWSGLVFDSSEENVRRIKARDLYWRHGLTAAAEFITRENINELLTKHHAVGDFGLLSIDVDGNDYWIWRAIEVASPRIVVIEYNSRLGPDRAATIPYRPDFSRARAHHSMIYYGASLRALWKLGREKRYQLVCCNSAGNNAFFVREDVLPDGLAAASVKDAFVRGQFRESRDQAGQLTNLSAEDEHNILAGLDWVEV